MKQPTQKPTALSNQVAKLHVNTTVACNGKYALPNCSRNRKNEKQAEERVKPTSQANRFGLAGVQLGFGWRTIAISVPNTPIGARGVNPNFMLNRNSQKTKGKRYLAKYSSSGQKKTFIMATHVMTLRMPALARTACSSMYGSSGLAGLIL